VIKSKACKGKKHEMMVCLYKLLTVRELSKLILRIQSLKAKQELLFNKILWVKILKIKCNKGVKVLEASINIQLHIRIEIHYNLNLIKDLCQKTLIKNSNKTLMVEERVNSLEKVEVWVQVVYLVAILQLIQEISK